LSAEQREREQRVELNFLLRALGYQQTEASLSLSLPIRATFRSVPVPPLPPLNLAFSLSLSLSRFSFSLQISVSLSLTAFPSVCLPLCPATCLVARATSCKLFFCPRLARLLTRERDKEKLKKRTRRDEGFTLKARFYFGFQMIYRQAGGQPGRLPDGEHDAAQFKKNLNN
jgi:hypothetical protein